MNPRNPAFVPCPTCTSLGSRCYDLNGDYHEQLLPVGIFHRARIVASGHIPVTGKDEQCTT